MTLFQMLDKLNSEQIEVCLQTRYHPSPYFNLKVVDVYGKEYYINEDNIFEVMNQLKFIRSDLFNNNAKPLPVPAGFPTPPR